MAVSQRFHRTPAALILAASLTLAGWPSFAVAKEAWHICQPYEIRVTCVVDGDTFWYHGEKMRLLDVDTPAVDGACPHEQQLAAQATDLLLALLTSGIVSISRHGFDDYQRTLVRVKTRDGRVGPTLLAQELADPFGDGIRPNWCR